MFGFNVGVSMSYMKVVSLLQKGARGYASRTTHSIDIIPFEDEEEINIVDEMPYEDEEETNIVDEMPYEVAELPDASDDDDTLFEDKDLVTADLLVDEVTDAVLRAADAYLEQAENMHKKVVAIPVESNYDFASMYGLQAPSTYEEQPIIEDVYVPPVAEQQVTELPIIQGPITPTVQPEVQRVQQPEVKPEVKPVVQQVQQPVLQTKQVPDLSGMTLKGQAQAISKWATTTVLQEAVLFDAFGKSVVLKLVSEGYLVRTKRGIILGS